MKCFGQSCVLESEACEVFWLELCFGDWGLGSVVIDSSVSETGASALFQPELCFADWHLQYFGSDAF